MLGIHDYWACVLTGILLNLTRGQDTFFILGRSITGGRRVGVASALGITAGSVVHTLLVASEARPCDLACRRRALCRTRYPPGLGSSLSSVAHGCGPRPQLLR